MEETKKPELQADEPQSRVIGDCKAKQASEAVMAKIKTGTFAFLDVKMKIMEGKAKAQDITKSLDDAIKSADSEY